MGRAAPTMFADQLLQLLVQVLLTLGQHVKPFPPQSL